MSAIDSTPANKRPEGPRAGRALDRLREETSAAHGALDETLQIVDRLSATDQRAGLLAGYHLLHQEIETKVAPFLGGIADLDFYARRRSSLVAVGLGSPGQSALADGTARAFSSEVDTGSREENASKPESRAPFRFYRGTEKALAACAHWQPWILRLFVLKMRQALTFLATIQNHH
jgi:hypothetical protein